VIPDGDWMVRGRWPVKVRLEEARLAGGPAAFPTFKRSFIDRHIRCRAKVYESWSKLGRPPSRVLETFGGLGLTSCIIRGELRPPEHLIWEWYPDLCAHLAANGFHAQRHNSMLALRYLKESTYHLIDADFGSFTVHQWRRDPGIRSFCEYLFRSATHYVVTTDESNARLHLHLERYGAMLGRTIVTQDDYVNGLSSLFYGMYGFSVIRAVATQGATTLLWAQTPCLHVEIEEPAEGPGFTLEEES
jgi:hypothetical protein